MQAIFDLLAQCRSPILIIGGHSLVAHGVQRMTFDVDCMVAAADFDAWRDRLSLYAIAEESVVHWNEGGRSIYFRDPDHHCVELITPGAWKNY